MYELERYLNHWLNYSNIKGHINIEPTLQHSTIVHVLVNGSRCCVFDTAMYENKKELKSITTDTD